MARKKKRGTFDFETFAPGGFADRLGAFGPGQLADNIGAFGPGQLADQLSAQGRGNQRLALFENDPPKKKRRRTITF